VSLLPRFIQFNQDRLGTNRKHSFKTCFCRRQGPEDVRHKARRLLPAGKKTALFEPFIHKKINILPRQARDKHRENSKKGPFSRSTSPRGYLRTKTSGGRWPTSGASVAASPTVRLRTQTGKKNAILAPFLYKNDHFYQDRLGTNIVLGKALKKEWCFLIAVLHRPGTTSSKRCLQTTPTHGR
jgi:hypothetical protein